MATQAETTASRTASAGRRRRARRSQKSLRSILPPLAEQDVGDQVAAQREEHADAEQPAAGPAQAEVISDDHGHRERPQPVQSWQVLLALAYRLWHASQPPVVRACAVALPDLAIPGE